MRQNLNVRKHPPLCLLHFTSCWSVIPPPHIPPFKTRSLHRHQLHFRLGMDMATAFHSTRAPLLRRRRRRRLLYHMDSHNLLVISTLVAPVPPLLVLYPPSWETRALVRARPIAATNAEPLKRDSPCRVLCQFRRASCSNKGQPTSRISNPRINRNNSSQGIIT